MKFRGAVAIVVVMAGLTFTTWAQSPDGDLFNERLLQAFAYRNIGPFRMGARTSDIAVPASPPKAHLYTFYVSFWTGGGLTGVGGSEKFWIGATSLLPVVRAK